MSHNMSPLVSSLLLMVGGDIPKDYQSMVYEAWGIQYATS